MSAGSGTPVPLGPSHQPELHTLNPQALPSAQPRPASPFALPRRHPSSCHASSLLTLGELKQSNSPRECFSREHSKFLNRGSSATRVVMFSPSSKPPPSFGGGGSGAGLRAGLGGPWCRFPGPQRPFDRSYCKFQMYS